MRRLLTRLGPGLLYAGAAVGVSHLVQSTRAGTSYGFFMVLIVLAANLLKYPFFKAGPIYAATYGKSLLEAFYEQGKWAMGLFYVITFSAMFTVQAVVTLLTGSVLSSIFDLTFQLWQVCAAILLVCSSILMLGRFRLLDSLMKTVILLLTVTSLITLLAAFVFEQPATFTVDTFSFSNSTHLFFLIALVGWMPAPLDISLWHSEWTLKAAEEKGEALNLKKSTLDFNIGYWGTTVLAIVFVLLGALLLRGKVADLPASGAAFSGQLIEMYVNTLGQWSFGFVALAAFTTMFSTTLTVLDAYPRVLSKAFQLHSKKESTSTYKVGIPILSLGALFVLIFQLDNMKQLVDFATTVSFLTAPILATMIYRTVQKGSKKLYSSLEKGLAWCGLIFLYAFSIHYIWLKWI